MADKKIGGKIVIDGESEFRANLTSAKKALENFQSEMKLVTTQFKENANSVEALTKKQQTYTKMQEEMRRKVSLLSEMQEKAVRKYEEEQDTLKHLAEQRESLNAELDEARRAYGENSEEVQKLTDDIEDINKQYEAQEKAVQKIGDKVNTYGRDLNNAGVQLEELNGEIEQNERYLTEAQASADGCATSIDRYGRQLRNAAEDIDECGEEIADASEGMEEYGNETENASDKTSIFGGVLKAELLSAAITAGIKALADGIAGIAKSAVESGRAFEASMSQVAATMGITTTEIANGSEAYNILSAAAQECGKATMFSASQAAEALNYLALAGYDAEKAAATLPGVLNLAAAGGLDLAYASDLVTDSMAALGLETSELDKYIDEMAKTSQKSNTSVAQLGEATLVCAGTVSLTGQSLESMNTALGVLANNGIKSAEGGTHLRNVLLSLSAPTDNAASAMMELGLQVNDSRGNMRDLDKILADLNKSLSSMSASQKTQMINKIFNKTDIAAVNALLKGTNGEWDALYDNISNCDGAAQNMADTLNDNLKGKLTILESAMEGMSISAYNLFDDEMKSAVDAATNAVGELQDAIDNGDLGVSLSRMSEALGEFAENAIGAAQKALPVFIDGLTWILENGDLVAGLIGGITAAKLSHAAATEVATIAQKLFNTTANANPYIMLATAISGVVGAVVLYSKTTKNEAEALTRSTEVLVDASKKLNEETEAAARTRSENKANLETQAQACRDLISELEDLQEKTELTAGEQARQTAIIEQLNQVMPDLNLRIDEQTGRLNMSTEALKKNVEMQMEMMRVAAAREDLSEIAGEQWELEKKLTELKIEQEEATKRLAEAQAVLDDEMERYHATSRESEQAWRTAANDCNALTEQIIENRTELAGLEDEYARVDAYISNRENIEKLAECLKTAGDVATGTGGAFTAMSEEAIASFNKMYERVSETVEKQISLFDEFNGKAELSTQELLQNMQSQVDGVTMWSENLQELAGRMDQLQISKGILQQLADMGPQGAGYVATFAQMTDDELRKATELFGQAMRLPDATAAAITSSYMAAADNAVDGFVNGIASGEGEAEKAGKILGEAAGKGTKDVLEIASPSKVTEKIGKYFDEGLQKGISDGKGKVVKEAGQLTQDLLEKTKTGISKNKYRTVGGYITDGLNEGINSGKNKVLNVIEGLCSAALKTGKSILGINSPSKEFAYLGEMSGEGYVSGWEESMSGIDEVISSAMPDIDKLYGSAVEKAREQISIFEEFSSGVEVCTSDILKNMQSQVDGMAMWSENLAVLSARGIDEGLLQHLADMGPKGSAYMAAFVDMTDEELQRAGQLFEQAYGPASPLDEMYETIKEKVSSSISLFEKFSSGTKLSTDELLSNMQSQITGVTQWSENLAVLSERGINEGLLQHLADMGPQGAGYVSTFVDMTDTELQRANTLFEQSLLLPESTAQSVTSSYANAGKSASAGFEDGILSGMDGVMGAGAELGLAGAEALKDELKINSPSKVTQEIGAHFDEGLQSGINKNRSSVLNEARKLTLDLITDTKNGIPTKEYEAIGRNITDGLQAGIEAGSSGVIGSIQELCAKTINTAREKLDIHSPSKAFAYLGEMSGEGYISGWQETMADINDVIAASLPDTTADSQSHMAGGNTAAISAQNERLTAVCSEMLNVLSHYLPGLANMKVILDTGTMVGELAPGIDTEIGEMVKYKSMGVL